MVCRGGDNPGQKCERCIPVKRTQIILGLAFVLPACADESGSDGDSDAIGQGDGDGDGDGNGDGNGDGDGDGDGDGIGFLGLRDVEGPPTCDLWSQDCPDGEKCVAYASSGGTWDANKCVEIQGDKKTGELCHYDGSVVATDDCDGTGFCWDANREGDGACVAFCRGDANAWICSSGETCRISGTGILMFCIAICDPLQQDCAEGKGCYQGGEDFVCATAGELEETDPCGFINDCRPGCYCADKSALPSCDGDSCCTAWCDAESPICLVEGTECVSFFDVGEAPSGSESIGICVAEEE